MGKAEIQSWNLGSGLFRDAGDQPIGDTGFSESENYMFREITRRLGHQDNVKVCDLGAGAALSLARLATRLDDAGQLDRVKLVATNREQFDMARYLAFNREALQRHGPFLGQTWNEYAGDRLDVFPNIPSAPLLEELELRSSVIDYRVFDLKPEDGSEPSWVQLAEIAREADFVHESYGLFEYAWGALAKPVETIFQAARPDMILMTTSIPPYDANQIGGMKQLTMYPARFRDYYVWQRDENEVVLRKHN